METAIVNFDIQRTTKSRLNEFDPKNIVFGTQFADHMLALTVNGKRPKFYLTVKFLIIRQWLRYITDSQFLKE
jgi:hypothetical protein